MPRTRHATLTGYKLSVRLAWLICKTVFIRHGFALMHKPYPASDESMGASLHAACCINKKTRHRCRVVIDVDFNLLHLWKGKICSFTGVCNFRPALHHGFLAGVKTYTFGAINMMVTK